MRRPQAIPGQTHPTRRRALQGLAGLVGCAAAGPLLVAGCGVTGLQRVSFTLYVGGIERDTSGPLQFRNVSGWDVTLDVAQVLVGPVYFNVAPALSQSIPQRRHLLGRPAFEQITDWFLPSAYADETANHLTGGRIIAQVTERAVVDVLSPQLVRLGSGDGVSEHALTAEVWLLPDAPAGSGGPTLPGHAVVQVRGTAKKNGLVVPFLGRLPLDEKMADGQTLQDLRAARRIPTDLDLGQLPANAALALRIDPRPWLTTVDFAVLQDRPLEDGAHVAALDDQLLHELQNGVRQSRGVYVFRAMDVP